jgi:hypothetical protein
MLITERNYIEAIGEMADSALFLACVESEDEAFREAAKRELIGNRCYSEEDIEDEIDRVLESRIAERNRWREIERGWNDGKERSEMRI